MTMVGSAWLTAVGERIRGRGAAARTVVEDEHVDEGTEREQPTIIKEWARRHDDGSLGSVAAWSDGSFSGGHFEYRGRTGIQVGPRYPYDTLASAFAGADSDAQRRGHVCGARCLLWREVPSGE
jgi:hypothetical protein